MHSQPNPGPHRTDRKRGSKKRVAPGVYSRAGKYLISYVDPSGRERIKTLGWIKSDAHPTGLTLTQAKAERERLRVKVLDGEAVVPHKKTLDELADEFFAIFEADVVRGVRSEATLSLYRQRYRTHIKRELGSLQIQKISQSDISRFLSRLKRRRKSNGELLADWTVRGVYAVLSTLFTHALEQGLLLESPLRRLPRRERPRGRNATEARILTAEEVAELLAAATPNYRPILATAAFTGMRLSELLGLRWQDLDLKAGFVRVRHQLSRATEDTPARLKSLKTGAARRDIVLLPQLAELLSAHRERAFERGAARPEDFVFATATGSPRYYRNVAVRGIDTAADRAGLNDGELPRLTMHDLRHTYASHLIVDLKLDIVSVSRQLGHKRPSITSDVYAGLFDQARHAEEIRAKMAASAFGRALELSS
jgi:integrase